MKRTFKRPDGTEETLEGTAEELAEYERKLNESEGKAPKPGVLKGKGLEDLLREIQPVPYWPLPGTPIWIVSCSVCRRVNCNGYHGFGATPYWGDCGVTVTMSSRTLLGSTEEPGIQTLGLCRESTSS